MSDSLITLNCILKEDGLRSYFGIKINKDERISVLKEAVWEKTKKKYDIDTISLELWRVDLPFEDDADKEKFQRLKDEDVLDGKKLEDVTIVIEKEFDVNPVEGNIHIIVDKPALIANGLNQKMNELIQKMDELIQKVDGLTQKVDEGFKVLGQIPMIYRELCALKEFSMLSGSDSCSTTCTTCSSDSE